MYDDGSGLIGDGAGSGWPYRAGWSGGTGAAGWKLT
jgi:hypothetical protein